MRPIKFKAKTIDGEWVEGSYINLFNEKKGEYTHEIGYQLFEGASMDYPYPTCDTHFREIDPNTLCQFTGLVDENGVEGCRYDKVLSPIYGEGFIQWCNDTAGFYIDFGYDEYNAKMIHLKDCEIIGNIHDKIGER